LADDEKRSAIHVIAHHPDRQRDKKRWKTHDEKDESTDIRLRSKSESKPHKRETLSALDENKYEAVEPQQAKWLNSQ
jgi:hypothetical protein